MDLVIVESPAKAKTINKYLGSGYEVLASYGHVRDLPAKDGSVDPEQDFHMLWEVDAKAQKRLADITRAVRGADRLILATDPDREGEAISWHVLEVLREKKALKGQTVQRVVFNAITKQSVLDAMKAPREIDTALVDAYLARRALDYLVGFTLSPVLWRKLPGARSAGRVQSVALRLVCDRERDIETFVKQEYWSLVATLANTKGEPFEARLVGADGKKISRLGINSGDEAAAFKRALDFADFSVASVEAKPGKRHPQPPFTTSTLQQEASRKLGLSATNAMRTAQRLYEGVDIGGETVGLITYMRTDGVQIAPEAVTQVRSFIGRSYDRRYLPGAPRVYKTKAKNAQEAHEAIRPTDVSRRPQDVRQYLDKEQLALYELIWKRTVASQMESAEVERTTAEIVAHAGGRGLELRASGTVITFDGFLALYQEGRDDDSEDEDSRRLPILAAHERLENRGIASTQHFTEPPPRYTEASLVKKMEELGIGRPSTYAATLGVLRDRGYVEIDKKRLVPQDTGRLLTAFLESFFRRYVEYDFTASLEEKLDLISDNELDWKEVLRDFWRDFAAAIAGTKELRTTEVLDSLNEVLGPHIFPPRADGGDPRTCQVCGTGRLSLKTSKFGAFIGCSNYPECRYTRPLAASGADDTAGVGGDGNKVLGQDPQSGLDVTLRDGRFGPYVQLGDGDKPKRASLPKGWAPGEMTLERAVELLALPRDIGLHPETGKMIQAGIGRYGPYISHDGKYANLPTPEEVFEVGINRAVDVLAEKAAGGRGARAGSTPAKTLGDHPEGGAVTLRAGRFGPYVSHGKINATIPKSRDPETFTLDEAVSLIAAKVEAGGGAKPARKKAPAKAAANGKAPAKKAAAKKAPAKKKPAARKAVATASD
ncbi:type I DNA topoisomerase [Terrihabitans rhizophilus]|jgi:DNA topoisomerase-1|uniref:DNA topoisomerase 1 n=1 Tax=Terrihabitans rhizophilus TaxID=3092662 RepID=A0ABU4RK16_9HYPH|nr:type I DNA topoisomerase [Terrihabitans sp. PJ23]MDX6805177.1 type I DNA topoisomerase [Terrihabitans sp. PJ23]